jgi:hypothetical protein
MKKMSFILLLLSFLSFFTAAHANTFSILGATFIQGEQTHCPKIYIVATFDSESKKLIKLNDTAVSVEPESGIYNFTDEPILNLNGMHAQIEMISVGRNYDGMLIELRNLDAAWANECEYMS